MFGKKKSFKNDKELTKKEFFFLHELSGKLNFIYTSFKDQMQEGVIVAISPNPLGRKGSYTFTLDSVKWDLLCDKAKSSFKILGVFASRGDDKKEIQISTNEGLMIGFFCEISIELLDPFSIDITHIYEKHFLNPDSDEIVEIISFLKPYASKLDLFTSFKIRLDTDYYTIKDLGDGNYLAVNKGGQIFQLSHDPFLIKKLHNTIADFIKTF